MDEDRPSRTRSLTYVMAAFLVAFPAMILVYLWATGG
jgi:membrane-anchored protein YejM (alkaline phosphatase superfamily)